MQLWRWLAAALLALPYSVSAQAPALEPAHPDLAALPVYEPDPALRGPIRIWGHVFFNKVMAAWEAGFSKLQPDVTFETKLVSSAAATGALFTHTADIGVLGREIRPMEVAGYNRVMRFKPLGLEVMTGACANADKSPALTFFVHDGNPLEHLSFAQVDAIFGTERRRGEAKLIRTWGDLGLTGAIAAEPIRLYTGEPDASPMFWLSHVVLKDSLLFNPNLSHFDDATLADGKGYPGAQAALDHLAKDPFGLALSDACFRAPGTHAVELSEADGGPYVPATAETIYRGTYPLTRSAWIYVNQAPTNASASPAAAPEQPNAQTRAFLRYILSRAGQQAVLEEGEYIPLNPAKDAEQSARLR